MRKIVLGVFFLQVIFCEAQIVRTPVTSTYTRLGAYTLQHTDAFSFGANQAALANINAVSGGVYGERRFFLEELSLYQAAVALPTGTGNFGLQGSYAGSIDYNETIIGFAYGRKLGSKLNIGAQFNYHSIKLAGYGSASAINFEGGLLYHFTEQFHVGIHTYNPTGASFQKNEEEKLPAIYTAGLGYEVSNKFFISGELQKLDEDLNVNAGMQYSFDEKLFARAGFTSTASVYYLGLGVMLKSFRLDATASVHPELGITPGLLLLFKGSDKKQ
ncbi:MAG: hypothetical protein ABR503_11375 [Chitinophagaceae bacterium]